MESHQRCPKNKKRIDGDFWGGKKKFIKKERGKRPSGHYKKGERRKRPSGRHFIYKYKRGRKAPQ